MKRYVLALSSFLLFAAFFSLPAETHAAQPFGTLSQTYPICVTGTVGQPVAFEIQRVTCSYANSANYSIQWGDGQTTNNDSVPLGSCPNNIYESHTYTEAGEHYFLATGGSWSAGPSQGGPAGGPLNTQTRKNGSTGPFYSSGVYNVSGCVVAIYPPAQPDLTVQSAPPTVTIPNTGTAANLAHVVRNIGAGAAGSFVNIFATNLNPQGTAWGTVVQTGTISSLASNTNANTSAMFPAGTFSAPGAYQYVLCANRTSSWSESVSQSDNTNDCSTPGIIAVGAQCQNGIDDDGDGTVDYGNDRGCMDGNDNTEGPDAPPAPSGLSNSCVANGVSTTFNWNDVGSSAGYYLRVNKQTAQSCPAGWVTASDNSHCGITISGSGNSQYTTAYPTVDGQAYTWWVHSMGSNGEWSEAVYSGFTCSNTLPQCSDGLDNDGDGQTDYPNDLGCMSGTDTTEGPNPPAVPTGLTASCNTAGTLVSINWNDVSGTDGYYVRFNKQAAQACPSGWQQASWDATMCHPTPTDKITPSQYDNYPVVTGQAYGAWVYSRGSNSEYSQAAGVSFTCDNTLPQCSNGIDDDGDGTVDLADYGCVDGNDPTENTPVAAPTNVQVSCNTAGTVATVSWTNSSGMTRAYPRIWDDISAAWTTQCVSGNGWQMWTNNQTCFPNPDTGKTGSSITFNVTPGVQYNAAEVYPGTPTAVNWSASGVSAPFTCFLPASSCTPVRPYDPPSQSCSGGVANITWDWAPGVAGAATYRVQVDNNSDFSSPITDTIVTAPTTGFTSSGLAAGTYHSRVRVETFTAGHGCGTGASPWSPTTTRTVPAGACTISLPDYTPTSVSIPSTGTVSTAYTMTATVRNGTTTAATTTSTGLFWIDTDQNIGNGGAVATLPAAPVVPALAVNGTQAVSASTSALPVGVYQGIFCADWYGTVGESAEGNNCSAWVQITIAPPAQPDLTTSTFSNGTITAGATTTLSAPVWNQGTGATGASFPNTFFLDNNADHGSIHSTYNVTQSALAANQTSASAVTVSANNVVFPTAGTWYVRFCADMTSTWNGGDLDGSITESNENNNCSDSDWRAITVNPPVTPVTASCSVSPTSGTLATTFTWTASASGGTAPYTYSWSGSAPLSGSGNPKAVTYSSSGTKTGSVTVTDSLGASSGSVTCTAGGGGVPGGGGTTSVSNPPTVNLTGPASVAVGSNATLTWTSTGATSCTNTAGEGAGGFTAGGATNSSDQVGPLTSPPNSYNYSLTCTGTGGSATDTHTISLTNPSAYITATPDRVYVGSTTPISWSASQVASCTVTGTDGYSSGAITGPDIATTSVTRTISRATTYTITCDGVVLDTVFVNVFFNIDEF